MICLSAFVFAFIFAFVFGIALGKARARGDKRWKAIQEMMRERKL